MEKKEEETNEIEIIMGDGSDLQISPVEDWMNDLKPKSSKNKKKVIIPKEKKVKK